MCSLTVEGVLLLSNVFSYTGQMTKAQQLLHEARDYNDSVQSSVPLVFDSVVHALRYYTILYYLLHAVLYYTILYYTILYYTIPYYTIPYYTILYYTILYYTIQYIDIVRG